MVEIIVVEGDLPNQMAQMRDWLDHKRHDSVRFGASPHSVGHLALRIEFAFAAEADSFAQVFGGRLLTAASDGSRA